jgi:hypothetical protein
MKNRKFQSSVVFALFIACVLSPIVATAQQASQVLGKANLHAWLDEAPGLPNSLDEAATRKNGPPVYQAFYDKVQAFKKSYNQDITSKAKPDEAAMRNAAEAQARSNLAQLNNNPVIAQMGGIEKLSQMTPAQRAQLAQQMMQGGMPQIVAAPGGRQTGNEAATTIAVRHDLQEMLKQKNALDTAFSARDAEITNATGTHREINEDAVARMAQIPMVNDQIMGRVHDLQMAAALNKEVAAKHRERAIWELQQRNALFADHRLKLKDLASSYQNWLKNNQGKINASTAPGELLRGANTEIEVAQYEVSFVDAACDLAKFSEAATKEAANYQEMYLEGNGAIRATRRK